MNIKEQITERVNYAFPNLSKEVAESLVMLEVFMLHEHIPYIVVGSIAFDAHGLRINRKAHDIDIEVVMKEEDEEIFRNIVANQTPPDSKTQDPANIHREEGKPWTFMLGNVEVNVFVSRIRLSHPRIMQIAGFSVPTLDSLLASKHVFHRPKDYKDLVGLCHNIVYDIMGKEELNKIIEYGKQDDRECKTDE